MSQSYRKFGYVLFGSIVLTVAAAAQGRSDQNVPTGDVWIAEGETTQWYGAVDNSAAAKSAMPTGDVWVTPDAVTRTAQPSAPPQRAGNKDLRRDGDSKKSHPASAQGESG